MTVASIEKVFVNELKGIYQLEEAASIAWLVIAFHCKVNRTRYLGEKNRELTDEELSVILNNLRELRNGTPVQYVLGETEFYGSVFKVDRSVLIPRPETEELVDWIIKDVKSTDFVKNKFTVLDIGTGSGCIPVTLKKYFPDAQITAIDISAEALDVAHKNAVLNHTDVTFIKNDILHPDTIQSKFNIIVSNPPYVTLAEKGEMRSNVLEYEPHTALFVADDDPLVFYNAISDFALHNLQPGGALYLEINENLGQDTVALLTSKGFLDVELRKDLRDKDRMIKAKLSKDCISAATNQA